MKRLLFILVLVLCRTLSATADTQQVSLPEALATAEKLFAGKDVDYYFLQNDIASTWTFFVDAEPTKGWQHDCYIITIPKSFNSSSSTTIPTNSIRLRMPPTGDFVPLRVKNRYGNNANAKPAVKKPASLSNEVSAAAQNTYAVIINGGVNRMANYERYWNDCAFIYQTLVNTYGVPKENIYPIMADGDDPALDTKCTSGGYISQPLDLDNDGVADIKLAATKANIRNTFDLLQKKQSKTVSYLYS